MVFNGTTSYVSVASNGGLNALVRPLMLVAWVKPAADAAASYVLCRNTDAEANIQYALQWSPSCVAAYLEGASKATSAAGSAPVSVWELIGFVWNTAGASQCYVNGAISGAASAAFTNPLTTRTTVSIGRRVDLGYYKGSAARLRIFTNGSADMMRFIFSSERSLFGV
jgi:hypothetical protein